MCLTPGFPAYVEKDVPAGIPGGWIGCEACGARATPVHGLLCMHPGCGMGSAYSLVTNAGKVQLGYYCRVHCLEEAIQERAQKKLERVEAHERIKAMYARAEAFWAQGLQRLVILAGAAPGVHMELDAVAESDMETDTDTDAEFS